MKIKKYLFNKKTLILLTIFIVYLIYLMGLLDSLHFKSPSIIKNDKHYRILTFNIAHGRGRAFNQILVPNFRRKEICHTIGLFCKTSNADIVIFQETDFHASWSGNFNHLSFINKKAEYPFKVEGNNNVVDSFFNNKYGNAIISKIKPISSFNTPFSKESIGGKGVVQATFQLDGKKLTIFNLHLQHNSASAREEQIKIIGKILDSTFNAYIIAGDFNMGINNGSLQEFIRKHNLHRYEGKGSSKPSFRFSFKKDRIDFLLATKEITFHQCEIQETNLSDHMPILMDFSIQNH